MREKIKSRAPLAIALVLVCAFLMGSAVSNPPVDARGFRFTVAGTPITAADTDINLLQFGKGTTAAISVINDNAGGGSDVLFCVANNVTTAAAGADGSTGSTTIAVKAGETMNIDGQFTHIVVRSSSGNGACRIIPTFSR